MRSAHSGVRGGVWIGLGGLLPLVFSGLLHAAPQGGAATDAPAPVPPAVIVRDPNGRAYNRTAHLPERRKMMQQWADYLDKLKAGAEVIALPQRA